MFMFDGGISAVFMDFLLAFLYMGLSDLSSGEFDFPAPFLTMRVELKLLSTINTIKNYKW